MTNPALLNALAHDAKLVLSFTTPTKYRDPSDQLRSLITSHAPPPTSSTAELALIAKRYTLAKQDDKDASKLVARHFNLPNHSK